MTVAALAAGLFTAAAAQATTVTITPDTQAQFRTYIQEHQIAPAPQTTIQIAPGADIPTGTELHVMPDFVVTTTPDYQNYRYFLYGDDVVIVDPNTMRVVTVIENY